MEVSLIKNFCELLNFTCKVNQSPQQGRGLPLGSGPQVKQCGRRGHDLLFTVVKREPWKQLDRIRAAGRPAENHNSAFHSHHLCGTGDAGSLPNRLYPSVSKCRWSLKFSGSFVKMLVSKPLSLTWVSSKALKSASLEKLPGWLVTSYLWGSTALISFLTYCDITTKLNQDDKMPSYVLFDYTQWFCIMIKTTLAKSEHFY